MREGWVETTLGAIGAEGIFTDGDWVESKDQDPEGAVRLTQLADIGDGHWIDKSRRFLTREKAQQLRCTYLERDDVLVARMPDPIGRACLFPESDRPCVTVVDVAILRPNQPDVVDPRFLVSAINSPATRRLITSLQGGTTRTRVSRGNLATVKFFLPPLPEQHRIVDLMGAVDAYVAAADARVEAARAARTALLGDLLSKPGEDWVETTLGSLLAHQIGGIWGDEPGADEVDISIVRSTEFRNDGSLFVDSAARRSASIRQLSTRELQFGDVLLEKSGGGPKQPVGRVVFVREIGSGHTCSNFVQLLRPDPEQVNPGYLFRLLWLLHAQGETLAFQNQTTGIRNLRTKDYVAQKAFVPPLPEQHRIVELMGAVDTELETSEEVATEARTLRTALLTDLLSGTHEIPATYDRFLEAA